MYATRPSVLRLRGIRRIVALTALTALTATVFTPSSTSAQTGVTCEPPKESNEAELLAFFATPIAFSPGGMLDGLRPGQVRFGFEAAYVPSPSREMQQPEACYG